MTPEPTNLPLIVASQRTLPTFTIGQGALQAKEAALTQAALIARVTNRDTKLVAVRAQEELKRVMVSVEKARKAFKEPILEAGRRLDDVCSAAIADVKKEFDRVTAAVSEFDAKERERIAEEERMQREQIARIEREKQAELDRLRREQEAKEAEARRIQQEEQRKAQEAQRQAAELAAAASNKEQQEAAQRAQVAADAEAQRAKEAQAALEAKIAEDAAKVAKQAAAIEEKASDAVYVAAKPVDTGRVFGQRQANDWEIVSIDKWALLKGRPDLVSEISFDMRAMKDELKKGRSLPGVVAKEKFTSDVRVRAERPAIDI